MMLTAYPTLLIAIVVGLWLAPHIYRRVMGFRTREATARISSSPDPARFEIVDLSQHVSVANPTIEVIRRRLRTRSWRLIPLEIAVVLIAFLLMKTFWEPSKTYPNSSWQVHLNVFLFWITGTWILRSLLIARPRIVQTTWTPLVVLIAFGFAAALALISNPSASTTERLVRPALSLGIFTVAGVVCTYALLWFNELLQRWRLSADTATHIIHWVIGGVAFSLLWTLFQPRMWWIGGLWLACIPILVVLSRLEPMMPNPLVFLRNFSSTRRSIRSFRFIAELWLEVGPIYLVDGPDTVSRLPDTSTLFALITRRLGRRYLKGAPNNQNKWADNAHRIGRDGRYRMQRLLCTNDTWESAVTNLLSIPNVSVIMDLRGLSQANQGCQREFMLMPSFLFEDGRLILLANAETDFDVLAQMAAERGVPSEYKLRLLIDEMGNKRAARQVIGFAKVLQSLAIDQACIAADRI